MVVLLGGAALGSRLGMTSQAIHILLGLAGLACRVDSSTGLRRLLGPTGGYWRAIRSRLSRVSRSAVSIDAI
jgi:biotin transporter BioY